MKNILIIGDSYSTFEGYIPNGFEAYYPKLDVDEAGKTWWQTFAQKTGCNIIQNNSWSGSTIGYTGYNNSDCSQSSSFIYRYKKLKKEGFFESNKIDTILIFGGTNDSWSNAPLAEMQFSQWEERDLFNVLPAICYFANILKSDLPNAEIVFIINTEIKKEIQDAIEKAAGWYGLKSIRLANIDKELGHPTVKGMNDISNQLILFKDFYDKSNTGR